MLPVNWKMIVVQLFNRIMQLQYNDILERAVTVNDSLYVVESFVLQDMAHQRQ